MLYTIQYVNIPPQGGLYILQSPNLPKIVDREGNMSANWAEVEIGNRYNNLD